METLTNTQVKETLININALLGKLAVTDDDVFRMADCRRALTQVINQMQIEDTSEPA